MNEFIEKLIARLEEINHTDYGSLGSYESHVAVRNCLRDVKNIVNQLAEEYKDKSNNSWKEIYEKVSNLEKKYANDVNIESVNDCIKLENLLQYFKEELQAEEHENDFCEWKPHEKEIDVYFTECGQAHIFVDGNPEENNHVFCPYCGKKIKFAPYQTKGE